ncbi:MAG: hypothetical protein U1E05_07790, partial [Patescibacteria group bacterium]|nr:hypothetical protein [Patescibacteria group bacterium]
DEIDTEHPTVSSALTDEAGKFAVATYKTGDGLPEGEYSLTFSWQEYNVMARGFTGPDKLRGRYADPAKSEFRVVAERGKPIDLGRIELTTK